VAPPGNQAANGENKLQPVAMGVPGLLDRFAQSARIDDITTLISNDFQILCPDTITANQEGFSHPFCFWQIHGYIPSLF
jgi:hypothetical protein